MGTPQSTARAPGTLPPIETQDQFHARFRQLFQSSCLSLRERDWLKAIFEKFSSTSPPSACWDESDLVEFMSITLPGELQWDLARAGPLLFRCVKRLGSFPWHNQPLQLQDLDFETLMIALVILLRRYESILYPFIVTNTCRSDNHRELDGDTQRDQWLHKLLFQCMAAVPDTREEAGVEEFTAKQLPHDRTIVGKHSEDGDVDDNLSNVMAGDDAHLFQAHAFVSARNKQRSDNDRKVFTYGSPIIEANALPSSKSQDLRGLIPNDEFHSLLKILLACQLYIYGYGPEYLCRNGNALTDVTNTVFNGISKSKHQPSVTWSLFSSALATTMPNIFSGLPRLFAPFIMDKDLDHDCIKSSTKTEVASLIREAFGKTSPSINESIFDISLLVKLATVLPVDLPFQTASLISTVTYEDFNLNPIRNRIRSEDQPLLLLVKGFALHSTDSDLGDMEVTLGAFLPHNEIPSLNRRQKACVLQLSNALLSFSSDADEARYLLDDGADKFQIQSPGKDIAELALDEKAKTARLSMPRGGDRPSATSCKIRITSIDLIGFTAGKSRLQMSFDNNFYVPERAILPKRIWPLGQTRQHSAVKFNFLSIVTCALTIVVLYQLRPYYHFPSNTIPGLPGAIFDFFWNLIIAMGTPFIAWNVVNAENRNSVAISIAIALGSVVAAAILKVGNLLLWGPIIAWWIAGVLLLSRDKWEIGIWWFGAILAAKLVELVQNRFS